MKKCAIIFIIIGFIITSIIHLSNIFYYLNASNNTKAFYSTILLFLGIMIFILALTTLARNKRSIIVGLSSIVFCGFLGGILYLCWNPEKEYIESIKHENNQNEIEDDIFR